MFAPNDDREGYTQHGQHAELKPEDRPDAPSNYTALVVSHPGVSLSGCDTLLWQGLHLHLRSEQVIDYFLVAEMGVGWGKDVGAVMHVILTNPDNCPRY